MNIVSVQSARIYFKYQWTFDVQGSTEASPTSQDFGASSLAINGSSQGSLGVDEPATFDPVRDALRADHSADWNDATLVFGAGGSDAIELDLLG